MFCVRISIDLVPCSIGIVVISISLSLSSPVVAMVQMPSCTAIVVGSVNINSLFNDIESLSFKQQWYFPYILNSFTFALQLLQIYLFTSVKLFTYFIYWLVC